MDHIFELCKIGDLNGLIKLDKELGLRIKDNIINNTNKYEQTLFFIATTNGHLHIIKYFISNGYNLLNNSSNILKQIILNKENKLNEEKIFELLNYLINELNIDINNRDTCGNTLLHYAILHNKINSANVLLDMGINKYYLNQNSEVAFDLAPNDEVLERIHYKYVTEYLEYITTI